MKIDTNLLSLQAERLETATKIYGVGLLASESFYELLSPERKRNMRTVDRVLCDKLGADGKAVPVRLYAVAGGADEGNRTLSKRNAYTSDLEDGMEDYINGTWTQKTVSECSSFPPTLRKHFLPSLCAPTLQRRSHHASVCRLTTMQAIGRVRSRS